MARAEAYIHTKWQLHRFPNPLLLIGEGQEQKGKEEVGNREGRDSGEGADSWIRA